MRIVWHLVIALVLECFAAPDVSAQGTDGYLPGPISVLRLSEYADALDLSAAQRHALDDLHARYREEFRAFNEREIAPWWSSRGGDTMAPRSFYTRERELAQRIGGIDNRLFDQLGIILSDQQASLLPRIRQARERERMAHDFFIEWGDCKPFDLSQPIMRLALAPEQRQAIEPIMLAYESATTAKLKAFIDADFANIMQQYDALERLGFDDKRIGDPANRQAVSKASMEVMPPIWQVEAPLRLQRSRAIFEFNRATLESLQAVLPPQECRWLRNALLRRSYSASGAALHDSTPFDDALLRGSLSEEQRTALEAESAQLDTQSMARISRLIEQIDAVYAEPHFTEADSVKYNAMVLAMRAEVRTVAAEIADLHAAARLRVAEIMGVEELPARQFNDDSADLIGFDVREMTFGPVRQVAVLLPAAISRREIGEYAQRLNLDAEGQRLLREVHGRYLQRCEALDARERQAATDAATAFRIGDSKVAIADVERLERACNAARISLQSLDDAFFDDVRETLNVRPDDAQFQRVRLARQRQWWNVGLHGGLRVNIRSPGGARESLIDLSILVPRVVTGDDQPASVRDILREYEDQVSPLMQRRYALILVTQDAENHQTVEFAEIQATRFVTADEVASANQRHNVEKTLTAAMSVNRDIAALNRQTIERIAASLPAEQAERLRSTYERLSWPRIVDDAVEAGPLLSRALALRDLSPQQRSVIEDLAADYRPAYLELRGKMLASVEQADSPAYVWRKASNDENEKVLKRAAARQRMLFDRYEMNMRVWQRLRGILTPEQSKQAGIKRIPPEPPDDDEDFGR